MKKRIWLSTFGLVLVVSLIVMACAAPAPTPAPAPAPAQAAKELPPVEVKFHALFAMIEGEVGGIMFPQAKRIIEEATYGRAQVTIYPNSQLIPFAESYRGFQEGIADFGWIWHGATPGLFPLYELMELPGLAPNQATADVVLNELSRMYPQFIEQFSPKIKHIISNVHMRSDIHSRVPIRSLKDLAGKVIAVQNELGANSMKALGASPTIMGFADQYAAAEKGIIDGSLVAWGSVQAWKLYEHYKYHTLISINPGVSTIMFHRGTWDKFTPQEQANLEMNALRFQQEVIIRGNVLGSMKVRLEMAAPKKGHEYIEWSKEDMAKMREAFRPMWNEWAEKMEAKGYPGKDILEDAIRFIDGFIYG